MIFVDRGPPPAFLQLAGGAADQERQRALAHFAANDCGSFTFNAFRHIDVRQQIERVFKHKCAYCESRYVAVSPVDIEHWRPKGRVRCADGSELSGGYYWLASEWTNLLASCIDCNRERTQLRADDGTIVLSGKHTHFPVRDERNRARRAEDLDSEEPLLLNPCSAAPEDASDSHLEFFNSKGQRALMRARNGSIRGSTSIAVYGLNRAGLVEERAKHALGIEYDISNLRDAIDMLESGLGLPWRNRARDLAARALMRLRFACHDDAPYAALARALIFPVLAALRLEIGDGNWKRST